MSGPPQGLLFDLSPSRSNGVHYYVDNLDILQRCLSIITIDIRGMEVV
jgi:hypothetical protein